MIDVAPARIRLLAIDIDGTLLDSSGRLPEAHRLAVAEAAAAGVAIVLATGRALHFTRPVAAALGVPAALLVNNGAVLRAPDGRAVLRSSLPRDVARAVLDHTPGFEDSVALVFDRDDARQIVFDAMDWSHPNRAGYHRVNGAYLSRAPLDEAIAEEPPIQVMFNGPVRPMRQLADRLRTLPHASRFSVAITEYEARDFALVDVNAPGCSKGAALARWAAILAVGRDEVMAVGDNLNDLEMLEFAGTAVVMGNAVEALKGRGFLLAPPHDEDGLAVAIRRFVVAPAADRTPSPGRAAGDG